MFQSILEWFQDPDFSYILDNFTNEQLVEFFTNPIGYAVLGIFIALSIYLKQKIVTILILAVLGCALIARYVITAEGEAVNTFAIFLGAAVFVSCFVIYQLLISEK